MWQLVTILNCLILSTLCFYLHLEGISLQWLEDIHVIPSLVPVLWPHHGILFLQGEPIPEIKISLKKSKILLIMLFIMLICWPRAQIPTSTTRRSGGGRPKKTRSSKIWSMSLELRIGKESPAFSKTEPMYSVSTDGKKSSILN